MFSDEMKEGTSSVHLSLEKKLIRQIKRVKSIEDYVQLLELMYGFYQPLQERIDQNISSTTVANRGRQSFNIINDIKALQPAHNLQFELCSHLPALETYPSALGALYVTEGSTLGGKIITGMIAKQLGIGTDTGFSFFNAYGDNTESMWLEFKNMLNLQHTNAEKAEMLHSAKETFTKFNDWISVYEQADNEKV